MNALHRIQHWIGIVWQPFVLVLAGAVISGAIGYLVDDTAQRNVGVLVILVALLVILSITAMARTQRIIEQKLDRIHFLSDWYYGPTESYQEAERIIKSAKTSILVLTHHIPKAPPDALMPDERPRYLQIIEQVVKDHLNSQTNFPFVYKRLLQSEVEPPSTGVLTKECVDPQTYEHCKRVLQLVKTPSSARVEVTIAIRKPIPGFPSMMIIDGKFVLLAITSPFDVSGTETTKFFGALTIRDNTGQQVSDFTRVFNQMYESDLTRRIHSTED